MSNERQTLPNITETSNDALNEAAETARRLLEESKKLPPPIAKPDPAERINSNPIDRSGSKNTRPPEKPPAAEPQDNKERFRQLVVMSLPYAATGTGLFIATEFMRHPIGVEGTRIMQAAPRINELWSAELKAATAQMQELARTYPQMGATAEQWATSSRPMLSYGRWAEPNPAYIPLATEQHILRQHWRGLHFASEQGPRGNLGNTVGRYELAEVKLMNPGPGLQAATQEWNALAAQHNKRLEQLRSEAAFREVGSFALGAMANHFIDHQYFGQVPSGWRTFGLDLAGMGLMFVPKGHALVRAGAMVACHVGARLWDQYDHEKANRR